MTVTRFAPSPTGKLHLGHAYSALYSEKIARENNGKFIVRIEDIDKTRCKKQYVDCILDDLNWLGVKWCDEVLIQSTRIEQYQLASKKLLSLGMLYPCFCTRKEIASNSDVANRKLHNENNSLYPGTCRNLSDEEVSEKIRKRIPYSLRLNSAKAKEKVGKVYWSDHLSGLHEVDYDVMGDVVIVRKDIGTSYHLAVTVDDDFQGVNLVTRGLDLFESTHVHRVLQSLLDLDIPEWSHHELIRDSAGKRYSKSDQSLSLEKLRESGVSAKDIRKDLGFD
ncbi:MAG: tRNA glutamyl-Q(34) synthetase GluQRS [Verrucomicrobia bacterium]|nr:tRNA glutamyl-Q(34) synthetase GluQRS [Verrucomicrobiota bacterium]OUU90179.1 MAG: tRNA glutamyl-Q(34) synthetase GluQRS [Verrucomicrobiaceae bacterium TMED76]RCL30650.1 MAG: tRNA glutamyl-Q(34) synthetase GluQRS [Verrucomicrobiota bacterium]